MTFQRKSPEEIAAALESTPEKPPKSDAHTKAMLDRFAGIGAVTELTDADFDEIDAITARMEEQAREIGNGEISPSDAVLIESTAAYFVIVRGCRNRMKTVGLFRNRAKNEMHRELLKAMNDAQKELRANIAELDLDKRLEKKRATAQAPKTDPLDELAKQAKQRDE